MQPDLQTWLNRKHSGPKPKKPLPKYAFTFKPRAKIQAESPRMRALNAQYRKQAQTFKAKHGRCAICHRQRKLDIHHTQGRGPNLLNEATWLPVCRQCHDWIHRNPSIAREKGFLK